VGGRKGRKIRCLIIRILGSFVQSDFAAYSFALQKSLAETKNALIFVLSLQAMI
jgi:hypothetical protein